MPYTIAGLLSLFVATEISGQRVVLNSLVQHQGKKTRSVGHGGSDVTLLLEKLVQLVPLWTEKRMKHHKDFEVLLGLSRRPSYHPDSLQVHFCPPQLFPVVMLVAFPLGDPAELSRQLKDVLHQRTPANFIHGDLKSGQETQR